MNLQVLPDSPGCYLFRDSVGKIIYIGKAINIKKRVSSYFNKKTHDIKTDALINNIFSVDFIVTSNEKEALLLENNLVKKNMPKYNIDLKDGKRYAYILLTDEPYPRLVVAREKSSKGIYFGPFTSAEKRDILLKFAIDTFRLRTCKLKLKRPCIRYQMGRCSGACIGKISEKEYDKAIEDVKSLLSGKTQELLLELKKRMDSFSNAMDYENAKIIRDQIFAIESLNEKQNMEKKRTFDQDVINYIISDERVYLSVFKIYKGTLSEKIDYEFNYSPDFLEQFIMQQYTELLPKEIIVPDPVSDALIELLSENRGNRVSVFVPQKGEKLQLLLLAKKNIEKHYFKDTLAIIDLKEKLRLEVIPEIIECFDISHISGSNPVGSMVRFLNGKPDKSNYRRFKIKTISGIDDYAMIAEIVQRRYSRLILENKELPSLIVIDGGKGQLSFAVSVLDNLGIRVPTIGLAKRNEEIFFPGRSAPLVLDKKSEALTLLQRIRDEAHRFALKYHKLRRSKDR
ncbi:MAG: excinuclease ABC subunit UvrC [archaeon]